jgi:hypothetical protein
MENTKQPLTRGAYDKDAAHPGETEAEFLERKRVHGVFGEQIWYKSVVAISRYDSHGTLRAVELHPVELHWHGPRDADRGIPRPADPPAADRILQRLQRLSNRSEPRSRSRRGSATSASDCLRSGRRPDHGLTGEQGGADDASESMPSVLRLVGRQRGCGGRGPGVAGRLIQRNEYARPFLWPYEGVSLREAA